MSIEQKTFNTPNEHQVHLLTVDNLTKENNASYRLMMYSDE